ncbi:P-loop containing nucleoside triphosphate hydrolase protein [Exophiala viscosa]|uniref:Pre-mRNA-splicing factor n=1 Tax=Exophiala viscosa TaxID=2486360 RepID=A0AAN6DYC7_9EURO|nr:P-loop containing nucleoside triphosphate hydrolase protein [Exophiala viscosa]
MGLQSRPALAPADDVIANTNTVEDGSWEELARKHWLDSLPTKVKPDLIKTALWDPLEQESFGLRSLATLENLQVLERFLWPTFSSDSSNHHVLLIAVFFNVKQRANLQDWSLLTDRAEDFSHLFRRILSLNLDSSLSTFSQVSVLHFVIGAFQSLENEHVRKECAPLVSISTWHNLHDEGARERLLDASASRKKAWKGAQRRFEAADQDTQSRLRFDRAWLYSMLIAFFARLNKAKVESTQEVVYCERFLELLVDLVSQLPTRRYTNPLLLDLNILAVIRTSKLYEREDAALFRDLTSLLDHFQSFAIDDTGSSEAGHEGVRKSHYEALAGLQRVALQHFEPKLKVLALSNYGSIDKRSELKSHFSALTDTELTELCQHLGFRTSYPASAGIAAGQSVMLDTLLSAFARPRDFQEVVAKLSVFPTADSLYNPTLLRNEQYDGSRPLGIPKLNLQYLTLSDFMWRSFQLYQAEAFYGIRKDMESFVKRMKPKTARDRGSTTFEGFSKMALPIESPAIIEVGAPKVGEIKPSFVRAEVILDVSRLTDGIRREWDSLRPHDVVFLLMVKATNDSRLLTNGHSEEEEEQKLFTEFRAAEVIQVLDDNGRALRDAQTNGHGSRPRRRRLLLNLDAAAYYADKMKPGRGGKDITASLNVIARRQGRENNFKPVLETIQKLVSSQTSLPAWLQEVYMGYGDPRSASSLQNRIESIDYLDTFLDWSHLTDSFPSQVVEPASGQSKHLEPPYVLQAASQTTDAPPTNPKKRRREQMEQDSSNVAVSTYKPRNTGPYPVDLPKKNTVRFTPKQVQAIVSGTQPGLTVVVGPPGTGKTDVATQTINLLYHNFPAERILLIAHSNQALNQLFQKIIALDIDPRHLLRLGHGEEELETEASFGKLGRVESFLENRQAYLTEVNRLAASIGAEGAHGSSCETADYFNQVFVRPAWARFWDVAGAEGATAESVLAAFPFYKFFGNAPVPTLFPADATLEEVRDVASGCQYHIDKIFSELESIRPFELLRSNRDQANHLLVKEARIIAMTSTHAAMRRSEIAELGFHYDTLIMEEAAQITEIESFIPCAMQNPDLRTGELPLKRIMLVGDHLQNSPIIQNMALRQYANFEQSLFLRFVRLGVPTIHLDQQGRCRPSIAELFKWRYSNLGNLPHLLSQPEFARANAGFRYDYQFIDVPEYQGQGEREPTPHFIQNLGEAEYTVALYQYMRLLGYPARSISILATYAGQRALIRDVLEHRCKNHKLFGLPRIVTTVDKYQGEQNDYVIVSMTRTKAVGYLRDVRRLTVGLSRARLGLYILGRRELFESCFEMKPAMDLLLQRPDKLMITTGEMFPAQRSVDDDVPATEMEGVEHLGQYVYEMTQAKVKAMGGQVVVEKAARDEDAYGGGEDEDGVEVDEEDPLHETVA